MNIKNAHDRLRYIERVYNTLTEDTVYVTNLYEYNAYYLEKLINTRE